MKICILGLWHLGCVTAACMAKLGVKVVGVAESKTSFDALNSGHAPLFEPGLDDLIKAGVDCGNLAYTLDVGAAVLESDYIWICYDTPVDENDNADEQYVINKICSIAEFLHDNQGLLISSQLPVGSVRKLEKYFTEKGKKPYIAYSPENLRLGKAIDVFLHPDRIVIGVRDEKAKGYYEPLIKKISSDIVWMSPESAEMTKHAINSFLATSVVFINEIASICESVGADAYEVSKGLMTEERIGPKAYLKPGNAFSGGTLARDLKYLMHQAKEYKLNIPQIEGTKESNDYHKTWTYRKVTETVGNLAGKKILILGLTYKEGTDTLRRSLAIELIDKIVKEGANVTAYDPDINGVNGNTKNWRLADDMPEDLSNFDSVIIMGNKREYLNENFISFIKKHPGIPIIDQNGYLIDMLTENRKNYYTIGKG